VVGAVERRGGGFDRPSLPHRGAAAPLTGPARPTDRASRAVAAG